MTRSELIEKLINQSAHIPAKLIEEAVKEMLDHMAITLSNGERIEIRGFGSFSLHYHSPHTGRNPKTGDKVNLKGKYVPHFKPGKELRDRVNIYA
ncbi:MAG: integration host factor subunit beta [Arsenophonus sp. NC-CH8-MAG3]